MDILEFNSVENCIKCGEARSQPRDLHGPMADRVNLFGMIYYADGHELQPNGAVLDMTTFGEDGPGDFLRVECVRCGYAWAERPKDYTSAA